MREQSKFGWAGLVVVAMQAWAPFAHAHISLEQGGTHKSRYGDGALKDGPCGLAGGARGTNVYTYQPGETITITLTEYVPHPSYFRIAFDDDGDDGFVDPVSIDPIDPARACPYAFGVTNDHCDASDFYNNATVLPNMDNLDPHVSAASGAKYTWQVTLPNVECANCTLQIIQVMQDPFGHGPYDNMGDVYHQCIDLVLSYDTDAGVGVAGEGAGAGSAGEGAAGVPWQGGAGVDGVQGAAGVGASIAGMNATLGTAGVMGAPSGMMLGTAGATGTLMEGISGMDDGTTSSSQCSVSAPGSRQRAPLFALFTLAMVVVARRRFSRS